MQNGQLKLQTIIVRGALFVAAGMIFYALGFSTNLYSLNYHTDSTNAMLYVPGAELYRQVQPFNRVFLNCTLVLFLLCIAMFLTLTHRRRLYYLSNYLTSLAFAGYAGYLGVILMGRVITYRSQYLEIDFERLREVTKLMKLRYVESTFMLDLGMVLSILLLLLAAAMVVNLVMKILWMRREKWLPEVQP